MRLVSASRRQMRETKRSSEKNNKKTVGVNSPHWNKETDGDRVCLIKFEDLLSKTNAIMQYLAGFLGIEFDDILLVPTFNKLPATAKARLKEEKHDTKSSPPLSDRKLTEQELNTIERETRETYTLVVKEVVTFE